MKTIQLDSWRGRIALMVLDKLILGILATVIIITIQSQLARKKDAEDRESKINSMKNQILYLSTNTYNLFLAKQLTILDTLVNNYLEIIDKNLSLNKNEIKTKKFEIIEELRDAMDDIRRVRTISYGINKDFGDLIKILENRMNLYITDIGSEKDILPIMNKIEKDIGDQYSTTIINTKNVIQKIVTEEFDRIYEAKCSF